MLGVALLLLDATDCCRSLTVDVELLAVGESTLTAPTDLKMDTRKAHILIKNINPNVTPQIQAHSEALGLVDLALLTVGYEGEGCHCALGAGTDGN